MTDKAPEDGKPIINDNKANPDATVPNTGSTEEEVWWKEASEKHGFKTKEDVYKSWAESNTKISKQGEEIKNYKVFQNSVSPIIDVILADEDMKNKVRGRLENPNETLPKASEKDIKKTETTVEDVDTKKYVIDDIVNRFEIKHGINKLDEDTKKEIKAKVGMELKKFASPDSLKASVLPSQLEDAFALALAKNTKLKETFDSNDDINDYGSMPSQSSGKAKDGTITLTPEQEKVAEHMPGGRDAYIEGLKAIQG